MNKFDKLKSISNNAAQQASADCAAKIQRLTNTQLEVVLKELKNSRLNQVEITELVSTVERATDKNKALRDLVGKSQAVCQAVGSIVGKIL